MSTQDSFTIESLGLNSQPGSGNSAYAAPARPQPGKILVPRRQPDQVQLSREASREEASANSLCSNFLAAWS